MCRNIATSIRPMTADNTFVVQEVRYMPVLHYLRMLLTYMCVITMTSARLGADLSLPITHLRLAALHCRLPPIPVECQPERLWLWWTHTHNLTSLWRPRTKHTRTTGGWGRAGSSSRGSPAQGRSPRTSWRGGRWVGAESERVEG